MRKKKKQEKSFAHFLKKQDPFCLCACVGNDRVKKKTLRHKFSSLAIPSLCMVHEDTHPQPDARHQGCQVLRAKKSKQKKKSCTEKKSYPNEKFSIIKTLKRKGMKKKLQLCYFPRE